MPTYQVDVYIRKLQTYVIREETQGRARQTAIRLALLDHTIARGDITDAIVIPPHPAAEGPCGIT
mgnify:FL=1